jgi:hypothetical protein
VSRLRPPPTWIQIDLEDSDGKAIGPCIGFSKQFPRKDVFSDVRVQHSA